VEKQKNSSNMVALHENYEALVDERALKEAYSPVPGLYAAKLAQIVFGKQFEEAAMGQGLDELDQYKLRAIVGRFEIRFPIESGVLTL
jgi:hypothetical protein